MTKYFHQPVLLKEVLEYLNLQPGQNIIDATLGGGGYSKAILERIQPHGKLLSIDLDLDAIENTRTRNSQLETHNWVLHQGNFKDIDKIIRHHDFPAPNGIVADIGFSSFQLDDAGRGISFQKDEPLDMRFDQAQTEDAKFIVNNRTEKELEIIFRKYGEEKFSWQIARKISEHRTQNTEIKYTTDLYQLIVDALPKPFKHKADDSARRIFQALRIAVNHELINLEEFLPKAFEVLAPGGRLAVVSFYSLEDRIVKEYLVKLSKGCVCPIDFPQCICGKTPQGRILTKKPIVAQAEELNLNMRSKPAKLRAIQKI